MASYHLVNAETDKPSSGIAIGDFCYVLTTNTIYQTADGSTWSSITALLPSTASSSSPSLAYFRKMISLRM